MTDEQEKPPEPEASPTAAATSVVTSNGGAIALPVSVHDTVRFQPGQESGAPEEAGQPTFILGHWTRVLSTKMKGHLVRQGLRYPPDALLVLKLREALAAATGADVLSPSELAGAEGLLAEWETSDGQTTMTKERLHQLQELQQAISPLWPPFAALCAQRVEYLEMLPYLSAKLMLRGWENMAVPFERRHGEVTDDCLEAAERVRPGTIDLVGWRAWALKALTGRQIKN